MLRERANVDSLVGSGDDFYFGFRGLGLCLVVQLPTIPCSVPENNHYLSSLKTLWVDGAQCFRLNLGTQFFWNNQDGSVMWLAVGAGCGWKSIRGR